ncbi:hypothetical protein [Brachybacterium sp. GPGPB12]|uniref:hypothetical protein n=1 Tax=Brachybacterium sp. GPGPB12 TaxID=3023517 RepID=UPI00313431B5
MVESRREILRASLRRLWAPALVLLGLWYVLLTLYVVGASPTFWFFSLLAGLGDPAYLRQAMSALNFTSEGLWTAFLLAPGRRDDAEPARGAAGAAPDRTAAAPPLPLRDAVPARRRGPHHRDAPRGAGAHRPRPAADGRARPAATLDGARRGPAVRVVRRADRPRTRLGARAPHRARRASARDHLPRGLAHRGAHRHRPGAPTRRRPAHLAQDRRHLPPNPGTPAADGARSPRGALTALALIARSALTWVLPALAGTSWLVLGIADLVTVLSSLSATGLSQVETPLRWRHLAVGLPLLVLVAAGARSPPRSRSSSPPATARRCATSAPTPSGRTGPA